MIQFDNLVILLILSIPPRLSVSEVMGILKGKIAIKIFQSFPAFKKKLYWGNHFWSRGYCISIICLNETKIRKYVKYQEDRERQEEIDQKEFGLFQRPFKASRYAGRWVTNFILIFLSHSNRVNNLKIKDYIDWFI